MVYGCSTACIKLEEYETAKSALEIGASLAPEDTRFANLIKQCDECIADETADLSKQVLEAPANVVSKQVSEAVADAVSMEDVQPVIDLSGQVPVVTAAKPKYRLVYFPSCFISADIVVRSCQLIYFFAWFFNF